LVELKRTKIVQFLGHPTYLPNVTQYEIEVTGSEIRLLALH